MARVEEFSGAREKTGLSVLYREHGDGNITVALVGEVPLLESLFTSLHQDEARILFMQASEILESRAHKGESAAAIEALLRRLFALYAPVA